MNTTKRYPREGRERAARMVFEHETEYESQWAAIGSITAKTECTAETLRKWVREDLNRLLWLQDTRWCQ